MLKSLAYGVVGGGLLLGIALAWSWHRLQQEPLGFTHETSFEVRSGESLATVLRRWQSNAWLRSPGASQLLKVWSQWRGWSGRIQAGEFLLRPGQTATQALAMLVRGEIRQHQFTIIEGWTYRELREALAAQPALTHTLHSVSDAELMRRLGSPGVHAEGQFLPETYHFPKGLTDFEFLRRAHQQLGKLLAAEWADRDPDVPLKSAYEALILASIVEKETALAQERPAIAGVFARRLLRGMRLQTDPTVIYGLGEAFDGNLRRRDLMADTPYNSYTRAGLPPSPIALAGSSAIHAALHPAPGDSLYFVSRGDGSHEFSATLAEHNAAVRRFQLRK